MKERLRVVVLAISIIAGIYLVFILGFSVRYSEYVVNEQQFNNIISGRTEDTDLLCTLSFNEERLFFDKNSGTFTIL